MKTAPPTKPAAQGKPLSKKMPKRRLASAEVRESYKQWFKRSKDRLWVGVSGGLGSLSAGDSATQTEREGVSLNKNILVGLNVDFRTSTFYGAELDGYYGLAGQQTIEYNGGISDKTSLAHMGAFPTIKGQYPLILGNMFWVPKLGVGYGFTVLNNKIERTTPSDTENRDTKQSINGAFFLVGLDVEPTANLTFSVDYLRSLTASGTIADQTGSETLNGAGFDRIRIGGYYRAFPGVLLGAQFSKRSFKHDQTLTPPVEGGVSSQESLTQIAGIAYFEF